MAPSGLEPLTRRVADGIPGKNMEPMHPWCLCTTMPWDEDMEALLADETRWAKDPETGKTVQVPMAMIYEEWQKEYDRLHPDMPLASQRDKIYNRSADAKQYENYKFRLGKDFMPKTLDDFQNLKYNKSGAEQWADMKMSFRAMGYIKPIDEEKVLNDAKSGGRHSGKLKDAETWDVSSIESAAKSYRKTANEHIEKIKNPKEHDKEWKDKTELEKSGLMRKWVKDYTRNMELAVIMYDLIKRRTK